MANDDGLVKPERIEFGQEVDRMPSPARPTVTCISRFWMSSAALTRMPYFCMAGGRGSEEYAGVVTEIGYGTDRSKRLQTISYKPLVELLNTGILFDVNAQGQGSLAFTLVFPTIVKSGRKISTLYGLIADLPLHHHFHCVQPIVGNGDAVHLYLLLRRGVPEHTGNRQRQLRGQPMQDYHFRPQVR